MTNEPDLTKLHIVFNGQKTPPLKINQLFDSRRFNHFTAITGDIDADFINRYLSKFIQVEVVRGARPNATVKSANEMITKVALTDALLAVANKQPAKLFEALSSSNQSNVLNGLFQFEYAPVQAIYSRFYLLSNEETKDCRVILGSIDLNATSFENNANRYGEVLIFDNDRPLFNNLMDHFKRDITPVLRPFFSYNLLTAAQKHRAESSTD